MIDHDRVVRGKGAFIILFIMFFSLGVRIYFLAHTDNCLGVIPTQKIFFSLRLPQDSFAELFRAQHLYRYLLKGWITLWAATDVPCRALSLIFGFVSLLPFYLAVKIITDELTALIATFLLGIDPWHIILSTLSMEEAPFYFFIFCALYYFFNYTFKGYKKKCLFLSAALIAVSCGFRIDGFMYPFILTALLLRKARKKEALIFFALSFSWPLLTMIASWLYEHNPFSPFVLQSRYASLELAHSNQNIFSVGKSILTLSPFFFSVFGFIGLVRCLGDGKMRIVNSIFFVFLLCFLIKIISNSLFFQPRYLLSFGLFFLIYIAVGFIFAIRRLKNTKIQLLCILVFFVSSFLLSARYLRENEKQFVLSPEIKNIISFVSRLKDEERLLLDIDQHHRYAETIVVNSGVDSCLKITTLPEVELNGQILLSDFSRAMYRASLIRELSNKEFDYILYCPDGRSMRWLVPMRSEQERIGIASYKRMVLGKDYWIYKVEK